MNFRDVDITVLIKFISELTGKNFLVDPNVRGNVTILSPQKVTIDEAYRVFLSVLDVHGYTAVPSGKIIKIIKAVDAKAKGVETVTEGERRSPEDRIITQLVPLEHGDANNFAKFLRPLIPKTGLLIPYPDTNTLIIIDVLSNVNRLKRIIQELDVPGVKEQITIFPLEHANAEKLATKMTNLFRPRKGSKRVKGLVKIIADERTNSLIILASPQTSADIQTTLEKLDKKMSRRHGGIHLYHLEHAVAEEVAAVLGELPGKGSEKKGGKSAQTRTPISKDVHISADKATNTLVIIADPDEYKILEEIIRELDVPRALVYVETLIMEVSASKALDLGVEWRVGDEYGGGLKSGGSGGAYTVGSRSGKSNIQNLAQGVLPAGFVAGVVGNAITLGNVTFPSISAFVSAVRTDSDFNVISTPQILTLDNEEAIIEVGQNIPYVTSVVQQGAVTDRPIQNFEYKDIGVTLKVTPHINSNKSVKLEIEQSIKNVLKTTAGDGLLAPTTTYRTTKSTITVSAGETAVIGGLVETQMNRGKTQTPCLGGVPGMGWAFKQVSDQDDKRNLFVFLTPHIIATVEDRRALYGDKKDYIDKEMEKALRRSQPEELRRKAFE
ncbi:MAG: type II secretion system secretin GspD [Deltaproteobacteria bacterium]|nr:type II secretion system secretin GspD [Deltaproteobacteria bacterium]